MKQWSTEIRAICPKRNDLRIWGGPNVPGISVEDAQAYCDNNGLGYCKVIGELVAEIPQKEDGTPDFDNMIDYENIQNN